MKIGSPVSFAVAFEIDDPVTRWLFGKFSYVVTGITVGNFAEGCSLSVAVGAMKSVLRFRGQRTDTELMAASTSAAFERVNSALYVDSGQSVPDM